VREGEILHRGQKVFVPDFLFRHESGKSVLLEIVGFWTPEYLQAKVQTLEAFRDHPILLAVAESSARTLPELGNRAIAFKTSLPIKAVLQRLQATMADGG
jgi:predicted nuclease of restriction endonuclease-like RecB superfamily